MIEICEREWASEDDDGVHYCNRPAVDAVRVNGYWCGTCGECGTELRRNPLA